MFKREGSILAQLRSNRVDGLMQPKGNAFPQFFTEPVKLEFQSAQEGRPIYEEREFVRIMIPGDRLSSPVERVSDEHKTRWPAEYKAFKDGLETPVEGVPLREWPQVNHSRVKELAHFNIHTVEQLAGVSDAHLNNLGMGARELRERAKLFLEVAAKGTGPLDRLMRRNEDLEAEGVRKDAVIAELGIRLDEMTIRLKALERGHAQPAA